MKIVALIENKCNNDLLVEHGLAIYIEYDGHNYLLDSGRGSLFIENAKQLAIDLSQVDTCILSHTHLDHAGGYDGFFEINSKAKVLVRDKGIEPCYSYKENQYKYVGIPIETLEKYSERFEYISGKYLVRKGVWLLPHTTPALETRGASMQMKRMVNGTLLDDDFAHEQTLVFECDEGLVILNSCSHAGVDNILKEVQEAFPNQKLLAMIGGFHLKDIEGKVTNINHPAAIRSLAEWVKNIGIKEIHTGHCTGDAAFDILKETLGEQLHYFCTGTVLEYNE
ncbi:MAG: MBL fold metallo-hydrolase [Cellulosilyticum sp.]|nr:MBL fold metallo-hydrolase [Cellulosilyticum sp.]